MVFNPSEIKKTVKNSTTNNVNARGNSMPMMKLQGVAAIVESLEDSSPEDAFDLIKTVERESRREFGTRTIEFYSRPELIQSILNIGNKYYADEKILEYVVRILKTITERCPVLAQEQEQISDIHDPRTQGMYDFLFSLKDSANKKIKMLVAYSIPFFPQFDTYEKKWEYILAIPKIAPKEDSMNRFRLIVNNKLETMPDEIKGMVVDIFQEFIQKRELHDYTRRLYLDAIKTLR